MSVCIHELSFVLLIVDGYTTDTLRFEWDEKSISKSTNMQIPQFYLNDLTTEQCDKIYYGGTLPFSSFTILIKHVSNNYICFKVYFVYSLYLMQFLLLFL